jgi:purine-nucleoside/S-methyl-5'-thioadenosine phosphorylase / adenosine deaminase
MAELPLIRWDAPGPYLAAFSTRAGGVSEAPFDTLNLGRLTGDDPVRVTENRRRLCAEVDIDADRLCFGRQVHGSRVRRGQGQGHPGDGVWTDESGRPLLVFTADCVPVVLTRAKGEAPAIAALHVGWRGLLAGIVANGAAALGSRRLEAVIGPGIGPCCYEVGEEVLSQFADLDGVARGRMLDLTAVATMLLERAGVTEVESSGLCTSSNPELFFSHRRDGERTGRQAGLAWIDGG